MAVLFGSSPLVSYEGVCPRRRVLQFVGYSATAGLHSSALPVSVHDVTVFLPSMKKLLKQHLYRTTPICKTTNSINSLVQALYRNRGIDRNFVDVNGYSNAPLLARITGFDALRLETPTIRQNLK